MKKYKIIAFFLFSLCYKVAYGQTDSVDFKKLLLKQGRGDELSEKVYLQFDKQWYFLGDTIWFKAYAVQGGLHKPTEISKVLYVELINERDSLLKREVIRLDPGIGWGDFLLRDDYLSGYYRIRAYTNWMINDTASFFDRQILVKGIGNLKETFNNNREIISAQIAPSTVGKPEIQFLPEGGYLVDGLRSKVAFKAVNKDGSPANIKGIVLDDENHVVAEITTQHSGMGEFPLIPKHGTKYKARVRCSDSSEYIVELPVVKSQGFILTINNSNADSILLKITTNDKLYEQIKGKNFYLLGKSGGKIYYSAAGAVLHQTFTTTIDKKRFPSGVVKFTMFSQNGEPLNERLVFILNQDQLKINVNTERSVFKPFQTVKINFDVQNNNGAAIIGSFSASVINETKIPNDEVSERTILTDLLLTSELKGYIENPNYYFFDNSEKVNSDLDLLMLTQGYRNYVWRKSSSSRDSSHVYEPEKSLTLAGNVGTDTGKPVSNTVVKISSLKDFFVSDTVTNAKGDFLFKNIDLFDSTTVVVNAKKTMAIIT